MTIPRYEEQRVETKPLPTVRQPTEVPLDALGSFPRINISGLEKSLTDYAYAEKQKGDQIAVLAADAKAAELETRTLYDKDVGVLNMKGKDALGAREALQEQWSKGLGEIGKDLHNDTQRMAFQRSAQTRYASMHDTVTRHISTEVEKYDDEQTQSLIGNERNAATAAAVKGVTFASAADRSSLAIARQRAAIMDFADRKGFSPEKREAILSEETSKTHAGVIEHMLANDDDMTAKKYFDEFEDQLVGQDLVQMGKAVEEGSYRGESQRMSDNIISKHSQDREGALAAVKEIKDPKMRDEVEQRVVHEFELRASLKREKENDLFQQATNLIEPLVKKVRRS